MKKFFTLPLNARPVPDWRIARLILILLCIATSGLAQAQPPATPTLKYPPDGTVGLSTTFDITWDSVANATSYHLQLARDSTFATGVRLNDSTLVATTFRLMFLQYSTRFFWRVRAINAAGSSDFSSPWKFKTGPRPPQLAFPQPYTTGVDTITALTWRTAPEAAWYRAQVAHDSLFQDLIKDVVAGPETSIVVSGLERDHDYWWQVAANNDEAVNAWSWPSKFRTIGRETPRGSVSETRRSLLSGNNVEVTYYNMGEFGDWENWPPQSFNWPTGSGHLYLTGTAFIVQARAITDSGQAIHPLETNYFEYTRSSREGITYGWWPVPGYAMSGQGNVAKSDDPSSWPTRWPGRPGDWDGQWNGYLGKGVRDSLTETYFVMDDNMDREYLPRFCPDSADSSRGGLGLRVQGRAMEWRWPELRDVLFLSFKILNEGTTGYDSAYTAQYIDYDIGGHDNASNNEASYLPSEQLFVARSTVPHGQPGNWQPVGLLGVLGLSTPDANGITGVLGTLVHTYDLNNDERNWRVLSSTGVTLENTPGWNLCAFLSSGPFTLAPGEEKELMLAYIFALDSLELLEKAETVRHFHRWGFDDRVLNVQEATVGPPAEFALEQNYPNPFNPTTTIGYALPRRSHVTLTVFNVLGQQVATLVDREAEAGSHEVQFDGSGLSSGVYFYRLQSGGFTQSRKLCLVK